MWQTLLKTLAAVCVAEMGDKTQFLVMGFASKHRLRDIVLGVTLASFILNGLGVALGGVLSSFLPMEYVSAAAGIFFLTFALLSLQEEPEEERGRELRRKIPAFLSVFCAFFLAELGDKTQLSAIAFAAREPEQAFAVFLGASIGLLLADAIGVVFGMVLHKNLPEQAFQLLSFAIFSIFGFVTLIPALRALLPLQWALFWLLAIGLGYGITLFFLVRSRKRRRQSAKV